MNLCSVCSSSSFLYSISWLRIAISSLPSLGRRRGSATTSTRTNISRFHILGFSSAGSSFTSMQKLSKSWLKYRMRLSLHIHDHCYLRPYYIVSSISSHMRITTRARQHLTTISGNVVRLKIIISAGRASDSVNASGDMCHLIESKFSFEINGDWEGICK